MDSRKCLNWVVEISILHQLQNLYAYIQKKST